MPKGPRGEKRPADAIGRGKSLDDVIAKIDEMHGIKPRGPYKKSGKA